MLLSGSRAGRWSRAADLAMEVSSWAGRWREAAIGAGLSRLVYAAAGPTDVTPKLLAVRPHRDGTVLRVRTLPGQLPEDYTAQGPRLAIALGGLRIRVTPDDDGRVVELLVLRADPLARVIRHRRGDPPGFLGVVEDGRALSVPWVRRGHAIVQGQTGSGKSVFTYGQLADVAADAHTLVAGIDPSGLLWRPFAGSRHADWQVSGVGGGLTEHVELLERLVEHMDARIAAIPPDRDSVRLGAGGWPLLLVVLEEYPGLLRVADVTDPKLGKRVRALVARLLAEGRKAGVRVLLVVQRADAAVVDGLVRAQCATRLSFSVDSGEAVRMLHPAAVDVADVLAAPPGIALVTRPGRPLERLRVPLLEYAGYSRLVRAAR